MFTGRAGITLRLALASAFISSALPLGHLRAAQRGIEGLNSYGTVATKDEKSDVFFFQHVGISSGVIHVYGASSATRDALQSYVTRPLPTPERWTGTPTQAGLPNPRGIKGSWFDDLPKMRVQFHDGLLQPDRDCASGELREEIGFAFSRHLTANMWHLHNDNLLGMVYMIQQLPHTFLCNKVSLACQWPKVLYDMQRSGGDTCARKIVMERVIDMLFDASHPWSSLIGHARPVCLQHFVWGLERPRPFYEYSAKAESPATQALRPIYTDTAEVWAPAWRQAAREAVEGLNVFLRASFGMGPRPGPRTTPLTTGTVKAVYVARNGPSRNLNAWSINELLSACRERGWDCSTCCDWHKENVSSLLSRFNDVDVVMGPHGAGLTHILYAKPGAVLIDFGLGPVWQFKFAMMADTNFGRLVYGEVHKYGQPWALANANLTLATAQDAHAATNVAQATALHVQHAARVYTDPNIMLDSGIEADLNGN